ncbi:MAG: hypothetical protein R3E34_11310 [Rhodocyclaceae bacterium]
MFSVIIFELSATKAIGVRSVSIIVMIEDEEVLDLCEQGESDYFDRKSARNETTGCVQDAAVGFANAEGGTLVIGIEDMLQKNPEPD